MLGRHHMYLIVPEQEPTNTAVSPVTPLQTNVPAIPETFTLMSVATPV